jgi:hypothetical protein
MPPALPRYALHSTIAASREEDIYFVAFPRQPSFCKAFLAKHVAKDGLRAFSALRMFGAHSF